MAQLNTLIVTGDSRFLNAINGDLNGNASTATTATKATGDESGNNIKASYASSISISDHTITLKNKNGTSLGTVTVPDSTTDNTKLPLAGGTMTGTLNCKANVYTDAYTGSLNMGNSNIYGVNSIYTADASESAGEGISFYRDTTHVDTLWISGGDLLFVPNRELGVSTSKADSQKVGRFTTNPTTGQIVVTDGTTGGMKSTTLATTSIGSASAGTAIPADDITAWDAGSLPTLGTDLKPSKITAWSAGTVPTLGTALKPSKITAWSAGTVPTLGTALKPSKITAWSAGTTPTLGTAIPADDITGWTTNTPTAVTKKTVMISANYSNGVLSFTTGDSCTVTAGTAATLNYTAKSIPNVTGVGTKPSLTYEEVTVPNVTGVGTAPSLTYEAVTVPNVTGVGTAPSLTYEAVTVPNVTGVGSLPSLSYTAKSIPNISVSSVSVVTGISTS